MRAYILFSFLLMNCRELYALDAYKCNVTHTAGLTDTGGLAETNYSKLRLGNEFVVDRDTGRINGGLSNNNAFGQPKVLDYGSHEQAFKVVTIYKPMTTLAYLYIEEFNENREKPFMFIDGQNIFSGVCTPY
jgi:hypothetical protein